MIGAIIVGILAGFIANKLMEPDSGYCRRCRGRMAFPETGHRHRTVFHWRDHHRRSGSSNRLIYSFTPQRKEEIRP